ncbi:MAG: glycoside hydrolase [Mycobacterium sp.]
MKFDLRFVSRAAVCKAAAGGCAALVALSAVGGGAAHADPAQDNVANFNELSRQAQQLIENVQQAQLDLDKKQKLQAEAEVRHAGDLAALQAANAQLDTYQGAVDTFAAAVYMGGRADGTNAFLTAPSPQSFIDRLTVQRLVSAKMSEEMQGFRQAKLQAQTMEAASAESAAAAKAAVEAAAARQADLRKKESELQAQVAEVKLRYGLLSPAEQALLGPGAAIPTVGMAGLVPNAKMLAAYIIATYPGVQAIGGVRSDPLPDHPSGHAIDIMIGSDMALGDAINADVQSKSDRFNVSYTMWRVPSHFNHVHVTVH